MTFMITIALLKELGGKRFITTVEVTYVRRCSKETNFRNVRSIRGKPSQADLMHQPRNCPRNCPIRSGGINKNVENTDFVPKPQINLISVESVGCFMSV